MTIPISWSFRCGDLIPVIHVSGTVFEIHDSIQVFVENQLVSFAVDFIENVNRFGGNPFQDATIPIPNSKLTVSFSLIFPSMEKQTQYMEYIRKRNGS